MNITLVTFRGAVTRKRKERKVKEISSVRGFISENRAEGKKYVIVWGWIKHVTPENGEKSFTSAFSMLRGEGRGESVQSVLSRLRETHAHPPKDEGTPTRPQKQRGVLFFSREHPTSHGTRRGSGLHEQRLPQDCKVNTPCCAAVG